MHPDLLVFIQALPEPTLIASGDGEVLFANHAAGELSGVDSRSLAGTRLTTLIKDPPFRLQDYLRLCARSKQFIPGAFCWLTGGRATLEVRCDGMVLAPRTNESPAQLLIRCRPKAEATDQFALLNQKIAGLSKEVLERKKAEQQRDELLRGERAARVEAERASRMKEEFLTTLSHELRTPLNAIFGWAQLLSRKPDLDPDTRNGLTTIERNARAQKQLIEDLLDMSAIVSGKVRLNVQRVELSTVVEAAIDAVRPAADAKNIRLQVTLDPVAGPVKGDPSRLQQIVWNLLSNAVKFTPKGGRIQVFLERADSHVQIVVSDTGEGIKPEFLPHVFDRFRQADASTSRRHGGLGLGLSLVKQLAELHGGSVRVNSPGVGQGATFVIVLPLLVLHESEEFAQFQSGNRRISVERPFTEDIALGEVTVLVVDDESDARELVRQFLAECQAKVVTAASGEEALDIIRREKIDILISDIGMPGMDGYGLMRAIRVLRPEEGGQVPAIALTAFARSEDRTHAMLAGYTVHLAKPIEAFELVATVASLAGKTGGRGKLPSS